MREIKFRAWVKSQDRMIDWDSGNDNVLRYFNQMLDDSEDTIIMQFTGIKDQRGTEIYEGDVVFNHSVSVEKTGEVIFSDIHHAYIIEYPRTHRDNWEFMHGDEHNLEVKGNIYQNPEIANKR